LKKIRIPTACPNCRGGLEVKEVYCPECGLTMRGDFEFPSQWKLTPEDWEFVAVFMRNSGNMKDVQSELRLSYPTVRKMLDRVSTAFGAPAGRNRDDVEKDIMDRLKAGEISVEEALSMLKKK